MPKKRITKEVKVREISKKHPDQLKQEIFIDTDSQGHVNNPAGQQEYPGLRKHKPNIKHNDEDAPLFTEKDVGET